MNIITKNVVGLKKELKKIRWPKKEEMIKFSVATIALLIFFGIFFYGIDSLLALIEMLVG